MKVRKELWFGFSLMAMIVITVLVLTPWSNLFDAHLSKADLGVLGLLMLALIVVAIMLGFPTAFTLMGMGVFFAWLAYRSVNPNLAAQQVLDLFVQRTYGVMSNDVLIAIPLFLFMGYLVERAQLIDRLFHSLHLATSRVPGSLAVATIVTCAIFATATGIVGAVVTLMGLLALPAMLKAGYNIKVAAGVITAGGCLGILIPPSVLLIVYGATAGVSVVQLYAGAFFPGMMLAGLYIGYVIVLAKWKPALMPPLSESEQRVALPPMARTLAQRGSNALIGLWRALTGGGSAGVAKRTVLAQLFVTLVPALFIVAVLGVTYRIATAPEVEASTAGLIEAGGLVAAPEPEREVSTGLLGEPEAEEKESGVKEPPFEGAKEAPEAAKATAAEPAEKAAKAAKQERLPAPTWFWIVLAIGIVIIGIIYWLWNWERLEVFKLLLGLLLPAGAADPRGAGLDRIGPGDAGRGGGGRCVRRIPAGGCLPLHCACAGGRGGLFSGAVIGSTLREFGTIIKESSFLTAKTSAMVCWLFVGSGIFSAAFALLGGQELIEKWVLSLD